MQHTKKEQKQKKWSQRLKSVVQINEQCCIHGNLKLKFLKRQGWCSILSLSLTLSSETSKKYSKVSKS